MLTVEANQKNNICVCEFGLTYLEKSIITVTENFDIIPGHLNIYCKKYEIKYVPYLIIILLIILR